MKNNSESVKKGVGVLIVNNEGKFLLAQRGENARSLNGYWENIGGEIEVGEQPEDTAKRETLEEIGVDIILLELLPSVSHIIPDKKEKWESVAFVGRIFDGQTPKIMEVGKISTLGWFSIDNLPEPLTDATKADFDNYKRNQ